MFSDARKFLLYSAELLFLSMHCVYLLKIEHRKDFGFISVTVMSTSLCSYTYHTRVHNNALSAANVLQLM